MDHEVAVLLAAGSRAHAAVAHHDGGDAAGGGGREERAEGLRVERVEEPALRVRKELEELLVGARAGGGAAQLEQRVLRRVEVDGDDVPDAVEQPVVLPE